ncbi:MAG: hypothetical protein ACLP0J_29195 [Solirubrobacteraceae bacterium]
MPHHPALHLFSAEDLFLVGLGFDTAGAYLVSRGLLQSVPQLASAGGTIWALELPRVPKAIEDRIRGIVGLVTLVLGFAVQATGYVLIVKNGKIHVHAGDKQALIGLGCAAVAAIGIPVLESLSRPRWRDRKLIEVARFDPTTNGLLPRPRWLPEVVRRGHGQTEARRRDRRRLLSPRVPRGRG